MIGPREIAWLSIPTQPVSVSYVAVLLKHCYGRHLPLQQLKVDQSFVRELQTDKNANVIAGAIVGLARSLGLSVIAEGVENIEQRNLFAAYGCTAYQGYLFGKPERIEDVMSGLC